MRLEPALVLLPPYLPLRTLRLCGKFFLALALTATLIINIACGAVAFATELRIVVAAGAPILTLLVQQGKISQEFADTLTGDLNDEAGYVSTLGNCFNAIPKGIPKSDSKRGHLRCLQPFESNTRALLDRHFRTSPAVKRIVQDFEAILQAAIIFYGGVPAVQNAEEASVLVAGEVTEGDIKKRIANLKRDLGQ